MESQVRAESQPHFFLLAIVDLNKIPQDIWQILKSKKKGGG